MDQSLASDNDLRPDSVLPLITRFFGIETDVFSCLYRSPHRVGA